MLPRYRRMPLLPVSRCFRDDGRVADWERLGSYVVARRLELGHKRRPTFANAAGISERVLGDIEKGRRDNIAQTTLAGIENALGWETGSALRVVNGGEPRIKAGGRQDTPAEGAHDPALERVMLSDLSDDKKRRIIRTLIAERKADERRQLDRVDELIDLLRGE